MLLPRVSLGLACGISLNIFYKESAVAEAEECRGALRIGTFFNHLSLPRFQEAARNERGSTLPAFADCVDISAFVTRLRTASGSCFAATPTAPSL